ncbi:MAG: N-acetyl sugar amidotransferase [Proteobacteria bacterium]|nr:N-acetyl sugar amidotransferase [Pseudomonadota bacterium]MBU1389495.1 N-acetyl sugar amidotransferase [Pseudomonadota bacterium]MBU1541315.1 N-acetyl sugar amidotransferase [Pseudomonadota bacterium]MBU2481729.1 N-acetyl sugar amidotransferase [Pseudomonadota bacterium]
MTFQRGNLERQVPNLPKEVKWCKRCVISNQRPRIFFNEEGICSGCQNTDYKNNDVDWDQREQELVQLLDKHRRNDGYWDVIVPSSGGKDSGFVAHQLRYKYGMNPLTVTWAPLAYTDIGWQNLQSNINTGFTNMLCTPNGRFQRKLARLCFEELGDAFHVFVMGQVSYPFHLAVKLGIPLVFYGENGEAEYAGDPNFADKPYKPSEEWVNQHFKGVTFRELLEYGLKNKDYLSEDDYAQSDLIFYEPPSVAELEKAGILGKHFFSYYHKWIPQENYYYCVENTAFKPNPMRTEGTYSKYASLDDKMDGFHYYLRYIKFGLGRCMEDATHEIRDGHLTREEGIALMKRYEGEFPQRYFKEFLEYLDITEEHFWDVVDSWRAEHLWHKVEGEWKLKYPVE